MNKKEKSVDRDREKNASSFFYPSPLAFYFLFFTFFLLSGCVRLTGGAGVWKQGAQDEEPVTRGVGFDTADVFSSPNTNTGSGSITV